MRNSLKDHNSKQPTCVGRSGFFGENGTHRPSQETTTAMVIRLQYIRGTTSPSLPTTLCKRYKTQNSGQEYELNETDVPDGVETDA